MNIFFSFRIWDKRTSNPIISSMVSLLTVKTFPIRIYSITMLEREVLFDGEETLNYLDQHFIGPLICYFIAYKKRVKKRVCSFDGNVTRMETHWPLEIKLGDSRYRRATISCYFRVYSTIIVSFFFFCLHTQRDRDNIACHLPQF